MYYSCAVIIVFCFSTIYGLEEGDSCTLLSNGQQAECKSLLKCPSALPLIQKKIFPQPCGFAGIVPIVCCSDFSGNYNVSITNEHLTKMMTTTESIKRVTNQSDFQRVNSFSSNSTGNNSLKSDSCTLIISGLKAKCISVPKCPMALQLIQKQQFVQTCGFDGTVLRVCCSDFIEYSTTSTTNEPITETKTSIIPYVNPFSPNSTGHKSFEKCVEYSSRIEKSPKLFWNKKEEEVDTCGFDPLIKGGAKAGRREFPHMVHVGYGSPSDGIEWLCGGSLISELYVMTAGYCLVSQDYGDATYARMGITNVEDDKHRQDIAIIDRIKHPQFEPQSRSHYNDIGLLKLAKPASFDRYVRPACLNFDRNIIKSSAVATGWGNTGFLGNFSQELSKVTLDLVDENRCNASYRRSRYPIDYDLQVCAGSARGDTCKGDGGGPLQIYSKIKCMYQIIGITSFGKVCAVARSPGVYTRVSYYVDWLERTIWG